MSMVCADTNYPDNPSAISECASFEAPVDWSDNYGTRMRGYVQAPTSGNYTFWVSGDDNCEFWLSTHADPANKVKIASVPGWTSSREWNKYPEQQSVQIALVAGQKYYIEAIQKEGGGGDSLAAGWEIPGGALERPIPGTRLSPWVIGGPVGGSLPSPWETADVGSVGLAGSATESGGAFTVKGSGGDIWNTADAFRFVYQPVSGDCDLERGQATIRTT